MKNIVQTRQEQNLIYVLSSDKTERKGCDDKVLVIASLFYYDLLSDSLEYLSHIPFDIDIIIATSNESIVEGCQEFKASRVGVAIIYKNNRGRDISSLLVACKEETASYDVIGFVHDKKTSHAANNIKWEIELWNRNIWENMLASESYIYEVLDILHNNDDIGLLCPPEPIGDIMNCWYSSGWGVSYDVTLELARRLRLDNADIDEDYLPVTIGTVFWAKREALRKLLDYDWSYEDFPTEPMPLDGTISHGVERILGYVAQDAGYKTGTIQTCDYAATMLNFLQSRLYKTFDLLKGQGIVDFAGVDTVLQSKYPKFRSDSHDILSSFVEGHENIYIYGAGTWAKRMIRFMADNDFEFTSVLVSDVTNNPSYIGMHPVFLKDIVNIYPDDGIIIAIRNNETSYQIAQSLGCDVLMLSALI